MEDVKAFRIEIKAGDLIAIAPALVPIGIRRQPCPCPGSNRFSHGPRNKEFELGAELAVFSLIKGRGHEGALKARPPSLDMNCADKRGCTKELPSLCSAIALPIGCALSVHW